MDQLLTLTDVQKILGDINWLRHSLKLSTKIWTPLFSILMGVMTPPFLASSHLRIKSPTISKSSHHICRGDLYWHETVLCTITSSYIPSGVPWPCRRPTEYCAEKKAYVFLYLVKMFCKCQLGPFDWWCYLAAVFLSSLLVQTTCLLVIVGYGNHPLSLWAVNTWGVLT